MKKHEFLKKAERHFDLIPPYFFNTFEKKIEKKLKDDQIKAISSQMVLEWKPLSNSKNFNTFVFFEWLQTLILLKTGQNVSIRNIKSVASKNGYKVSTTYFKKLGVQNGTFIDFVNEADRKFIEGKRQEYFNTF